MHWRTATTARKWSKQKIEKQTTKQRHTLPIGSLPLPTFVICCNNEISAVSWGAHSLITLWYYIVSCGNGEYGHLFLHLASVHSTYERKWKKKTYTFTIAKEIKKEKVTYRFHNTMWFSFCAAVQWEYRFNGLPPEKHTHTSTHTQSHAFMMNFTFLI